MKQNTSNGSSGSAATFTSSASKTQDIRKNIVILSWCPDPWGGCEVLWFETAKCLLADGHRVAVIKSCVDFEHDSIKELTGAGISVEDFSADKSDSVDRFLKLKPPSWIVPFRHRHRLHPDFSRQFFWLALRLEELKPDLVVVSQGGNFDGTEFAIACLRLNIPYVLISHKASEWIFPPDHVREPMANAFFGAQKVYFVSEHNRELTELQIGTRFPHAEVVRSPVTTPVEQPLAWPETVNERYRIATIGRLCPQEKGQDILLRVLAQNKWRERPVDVSVFGRGEYDNGIKGMAKLLNVENIRFAGTTNDVTDVWRSHQVLVMSSRAEGLPATVVEAMYCGRPCIVTPAGGSAEVIDDGNTGFVAESATTQGFDKVMERAWLSRDKWEAMGRQAAIQIRRLVKTDGGRSFAAKLIEVCNAR